MGFLVKDMGSRVFWMVIYWPKSKEHIWFSFLFQSRSK